MNGQATLNVKRLINEQFGGPLALVEAYPFWPVNTVYKWCQRQSLKGQELASILGIIEARDQRPLHIAQYLETAECQSACSNTKPSHTGAEPSVFD